VYVQPSREDGLPQAILEAMALGVPVVATDVGSVAGVVVDGVTGRLIAPDDASQLAAAIGELLSDPDEAEGLGRAGQAAVSTRFDAATAAAAHLAQYRAAIAAHPRGGRA
jgi:glycosyltransferase involved in cell wall biosynthesis